MTKIPKVKRDLFAIENRKPAENITKEQAPFMRLMFDAAGDLQVKTRAYFIYGTASEKQQWDESKARLDAAYKILCEQGLADTNHVAARTKIELKRLTQPRVEA